MVDSSVTPVPKITIKFFLPYEEELFRECLATMPGGPHEAAVVQPLNRFGYSGAKVFMFFPAGEGSRPYVGKIHTVGGIAEERAGLAKAFPYFDEAGYQSFPFESGDHAIIAQPLVAATAAGEEPSVTELADTLFRRPVGICGPADFSWPEEKVLNVITQLYEANCARSLRGVAARTVRMGAEYEWYLRNSLTDGLIRTWLGQRHQDDTVQILGEDYPNPRVYVEGLKNAERSVPTAAVHGDLHPSNVVLDHYGIPRLIDFTWFAKPAHVLKDFVLMECSIRFLMMPNHLGWAEQVALDTLMLDPTEERVEALVESFMSIGVDESSIQHIARCTRIVMVLRAQARRVCGTLFAIEDYWAAQALVLYGLMKMNSYPFGRCARALSQLCRCLRDHSYLGEA